MNSIEEHRLMYINNGLKESHKRFHEYRKTKATQNSTSTSAALTELLMWICISDEWHRLNNNKNGSYTKRKSNNVGGKYVKGLRYAFNSMKHVMSFMKLIGTADQKSWIIEGYFQEDYTSEVVWLNVENLIKRENDKYENQRQNYIKYVEGKSVIETVDKAYMFLRDEYSGVDSRARLERAIREEEIK